MNELKVKIKKEHPDAVIPSYAKAGDAGLDLTAVTKNKDSMGNIVYDTGLAFEIPKGYVGLLFPRSSNSKKQLLLTNHVGVIDSSYRGSVTLKFAEYDSSSSSRKWTTELPYNVGDRIGQLIILPYPQIQFEEAEQLSETERGTGGYGHTGN
jgi:dUTP pyrophosphatase